MPLPNDDTNDVYVPKPWNPKAPWRR